MPVEAVPVPVRVSAVGEVWALLEKFSVALTDPVACGVNVTVKETLWPAEIVTGSVGLLKLKAALFVLADETVTSAPVADKLPSPEPLFPTTTLPNASVAGETESCPAAELPVPVPESETLVEASLALLAMLAVAVKDPAALGEKLMLTVVLWFAASVIGTLGETREKYLLENETLLTLMEAGPELLTVNESVLLLPAETLPNCSVAALRESVDVCCWFWFEPPALTPWQPVRKLKPARASAASIATLAG